MADETAGGSAILTTRTRRGQVSDARKNVAVKAPRAARRFGFWAASFKRPINLPKFVHLLFDPAKLLSLFRGVTNRFRFSDRFTILANNTGNTIRSAASDTVGNFPGLFLSARSCLPVIRLPRFRLRRLGEVMAEDLEAGKRAKRGKKVF